MGSATANAVGGLVAATCGALHRAQHVDLMRLAEEYPPVEPGS